MKQLSFDINMVNQKTKKNLVDEAPKSAKEMPLKGMGMIFQSIAKVDQIKAKNLQLPDIDNKSSGGSTMLGDAPDKSMDESAPYGSVQNQNDANKLLKDEVNILR